METIYDEIDHVIEQLRYETDVQISQRIGPLGIDMKVPQGVAPVKIKEGSPQPGSDLLKNFYLEKVRPSLDPKFRPEKVFRSRGQIGGFFGQAKLSLPPVFHEVLDGLAEMMEERRELARQKTIHLCLHGWLLVHVPISAILMLLVMIHIVTTLWY